MAAPSVTIGSGEVAMRAIQISETGGPERLTLADLPVPAPADGEIRLKIGAIGVNFIDVYYRTGLYPATLPITPGMEAAGTVEAVGPGVAGLRVGDRVAYAMVLGAYAEHAVVPAANVVRIPDGVDDRSAAAVMLQGMTAHYLTRSTFPIATGQTALVHAAAGGVGLLLVQMAAQLGAQVIGTTSTPVKAALATAAGAAHVINYATDDFEAEVREITDGRGVDVVYDSVGAATFDKSLACLKPRGMMVSFGNTSGPVPPVSPLTLSRGGSLFLTRPSLPHYIASRDELEWRAGEVLDEIASGTLTLRIGKTYGLAEAPAAHRDLEGRASTGKLILLPS